MIDLTTISIPALFELHVDLLAELRRRDVVRSANNPTGDYGELLFSRAFGWTLNINSSADADAVDGEGLRHQIKCRRLGTPRGSRQLGFIRRLPERPFDRLAAVLLDDRFPCCAARSFPMRSSSPAPPMPIALRRGNSCSVIPCGNCRASSMRPPPCKRRNN
ncbi:MAG: hypothetical protein AB7S92_14195 [Parvibaculaceae bacterium]